MTNSLTAPINYVHGSQPGPAGSFIRESNVLPYVFLLAGIGGIVFAVWWPGFRLRRAMAREFPPQWERILIANLPPYRRLRAEWREQLKRLIKRFLHEKEFVGCAGLEITDEIRLTVAGEACLLLLNRPTTVYEKLRFIYIYPSGYLAHTTEIDESGIVTRGHQGRSGESWGNGRVVLSWDDVSHGARDFSDGNNVVLHEFAHQLDQEFDYANGAPALRHPRAYRRWAEVLTREYQELVNDAHFGRPSLLSYYGATNPAEFFAVATEVFYERPHAMAERHPQLFEQLTDYYAVDPREWQPPHSA